jgi:hypothetical protein
MSLGIDYFGRGHWLTALQTRVSLGARRRMFDLFLDFAGPLEGRKLLDVGATPDLERLDSNCMIPWFHEAGLSVTLYSPEPIDHLSQRFPFARILPCIGFRQPIPARAGEFDWVSSSAVLEHVGSRLKQAAFIRECAQVGRGLFLTTPDRRHWLEFHTKLPLIHWLAPEVHRRILKHLGKTQWAREEHLNLLDLSELTEFARDILGHSYEWTIRSVRTLGMSSNLVLLARKLDHSP